MQLGVGKRLALALWSSWLTAPQGSERGKRRLGPQRQSERLGPSHFVFRCGADGEVPWRCPGGAPQFPRGTRAPSRCSDQVTFPPQRNQGPLGVPQALSQLGQCLEAPCSEGSRGSFGRRCARLAVERWLSRSRGPWRLLRRTWMRTSRFETFGVVSAPLLLTCVSGAGCWTIGVTSS